MNGLHLIALLVSSLGVSQATSNDLVEKLSLRCPTMEATSIKRVGRIFRTWDDDGNKNLDFDEFEEGLDDYGCNLDKIDIEAMYKTVDKDGSGQIDFDELMQRLRPMSEARRDFVRETFRELDKTGDGVLTLEDFKGVYDVVKQHPEYRNGEWTEAMIFDTFLGSLEVGGNVDGRVTEDEFINYYAGVSASVDQDSYFLLMIKNGWNL